MVSPWEGINPVACSHFFCHFANGSGCSLRPSTKHRLNARFTVETATVGKAFASTTSRRCWKTTTGPGLAAVSFVFVVLQCDNSLSIRKAHVANVVAATGGT